MTRYAIDTDVLARIQRARHVSTLSKLGRLPVVVTDTVWEELTVVARSKGNAPASEIEEMERMLEAIAGRPTELELDTVEAEAFGRLHSRPDRAEDAGEHSIIAYASIHEDVIAVLFDRRALFRAVEELRGRVLSIHGFLDVLRTRHGLAPLEADDLSQKIRKAASIPQPLWW
jgi:predicted nucleic acid-binding protein